MENFSIHSPRLPKSKTMLFLINRRLMEIGDELCTKVLGTDADGQDRAMQHQMLQESLKQQSALYLKNYHVQRMDELRTFLECELWEPCPVRSGFSVFIMEVRSE